MVFAYTLRAREDAEYAGIRHYAGSHEMRDLYYAPRRIGALKQAKVKANRGSG